MSHEADLRAEDAGDDDNDGGGCQSNKSHDCRLAATPQGLPPPSVSTRVRSPPSPTLYLLHTALKFLQLFSLLIPHIVTPLYNVLSQSLLGVALFRRQKD